jgi:DNA uptake protein ComE-like DNA-binding protein
VQGGKWRHAHSKAIFGVGGCSPVAFFGRIVWRRDWAISGSRSLQGQLAADHSPDKLIDINHASLDQLMKAPGMTRSWAGRIVRFRPYRTKLDLVERGVVSGDVYGRFKDYVIAHREAH